MDFLQEVDDNCLLCSNCKNRMEKPKILPCLHLCCRDCLNEMLQTYEDSKEFLCPKCTQKCKISEDGIDGFRTDFQVEGMSRLLKVQEGYRLNKIRECIGCSKKLEVISYCFKCEGYLCNNCFQFHLGNKMLADHRHRAVALDDETVKAVTLSQLASLNGIPKCSYHIDKIAELCCQQCDNLPICLFCITRGSHSDHSVSDVDQLSESGREKIIKTLEECQKQDLNIVKTFENVAVVTKRLNDSVKLVENQIDQRADTERQIALSKLKSERAAHKIWQDETETIEKREIEEARKIKEMKILDIEMQFREEENKIKMKNVERLQKQQAELEEKESMLAENIDNTQKRLERKRELLNQAKESKVKEIQIIELILQNRMNRMRSLKESADRILCANDGWTLVQYLPLIQTAGQILLDELHSDDVDLHKLSDVGTGIVGFSHLQTDNGAQCSETNLDSNTEAAEINGDGSPGITDVGWESTYGNGVNVGSEILADQDDVVESLSKSVSSDDYELEKDLPFQTLTTNDGYESQSTDIDVAENGTPQPKIINKDQCVLKIRLFPKYDNEGRLEHYTESRQSESRDSKSDGSLIQTVDLSKCEESLIKVEGLDKSMKYTVNAVASAGNETVIITGSFSDDSSAVIPVNITTKLSKVFEIRRTVESSTWRLHRLCAPMTDSEIVTICYRDDIGVFDVHQGKWSVSQRSIGERIDSWAKDTFVNCISTDKDKKQIIVGMKYDRRMVMFDYQLNYIRAINLPHPITRPRAITVHRWNLLVCDNKDGRVFAVSMEGRIPEVIYEFTKPGFRVIDWKPLGITTDKNGFVYMLWNDNQSSDRYRCIVVQYSPNGQQPLQTREVDGNSGCLTVLDSTEGEKLVIATLKSSKIYFYDLLKPIISFTDDVKTDAAVV